jgi:hypothetical protein
MKNIKFSLLLVIVTCFSSMAAFAESHMDAALEHLRAARTQMELAVYGKPEQKLKALEAIDAAIRHVENAKH